MSQATLSNEAKFKIAKINVDISNDKCQIAKLSTKISAIELYLANMDCNFPLEPVLRERANTDIAFCKLQKYSFKARVAVAKFEISKITNHDLKLKHDIAAIKINKANKHVVELYVKATKLKAIGRYSCIFSKINLSKDGSWYKRANAICKYVSKIKHSKKC